VNKVIIARAEHSLTLTIKEAFLDDDQMNDGYCLTCVTYATSDVKIKTHCEDEL